MKRIYYVLAALAVPLVAYAALQNPFNPSGQMTQGYAVLVDPTTNLPCSSGSPCSILSGGGGGAVTIADGADVAQGAVADAAYVSGSGTVVAILKAIFARLGGAIIVTPSNPIGITPTNRTITSATGASQTVMALNASRHALIIQNTGNADCGVNPTGGTAVIGGAGTLTLQPTGSYQPRIPTLSAVTAICTAGQPLYAEEN